MRIFSSDVLGIDLLSELSVGWFLTEQIDSYGYYVEYREDGTTPVNILDSHVWLDERKDIVRRSDYSDYKTQLPLPIVSYDLGNDSPEPVQLGSGSMSKTYQLSVLVHAENKVQLINLANFVEAVIFSRQIPILNYNIIGNPEIGVIDCREILKTRIYSTFQEGNVGNQFMTSISCSAYADFDNNFDIT